MSKKKLYHIYYRLRGEKSVSSMNFFSRCGLYGFVMRLFLMPKLVFLSFSVMEVEEEV